MFYHADDKHLEYSGGNEMAVDRSWAQLRTRSCLVPLQTMVRHGGSTLENYLLCGWFEYAHLVHLL